MPAAPRDLYIEQGVPFLLPFSWHRGARDASGKPLLDANLRPVPGDPYDLTGWSGLMQIRPTTDSPNILLEASTQNGLIDFGFNPDLPDDPPDPRNGRVRIRLASSVTLGIVATVGRYDLVVFDPQGEPHRLLEGIARVSPATTRVADAKWAVTSI